MSMGDELLGMVMTFRVSELQMLLGYASQNKTGRKSELQARALALLKNKSVPHLTQIQAKIRELYKTIQQGAAAAEVNPAAPILSNVAQRNSATPSAPMIAPPHPTTPAPPMNSVPVSTPLASTTPQPLSNSFMSLANRQTMYGSMYGYQQPKLPVGPVAPFPPQAVHPDVRIKSLPFYDLLGELVKPSSLAGCLTKNSSNRLHESSFVFYLTPQQATEVASNRDTRPTKYEYNVQVQLRFCLQESSCEQDDIFPPGVSVKINNKLATLPNPIPTNRPGQEPKRPPRPVNISPLVKLCPFVANQIVVTYSPDYSRGYVLVVHLVRKLSAQDLLDRLRTKGIRNSDFTTGLIKEKLCETDADCEIATTSLRVSLLCPLGKMKMGVPARSTLCSHLQCFDASLYLQMNEKRPTWTCPVCDKQIPYDTIVIDGYFQEVLKSSTLPVDVHEVQLLKDGSWSCPTPSKEDPKPSSSSSAVALSPKAAVIEEILDDGDDEVSALPTVITDTTVAPPKEKEKKMIEIDLTGSDSDEEMASIPSGQPATTQPALNNKRDNTASDNSNSSAGGKSGESSVIMLDSPSPPASPVPPPVSTATTPSHHLPTYGSLPRLSDLTTNHAYPQIIQSAGQNLNRPLVMQIRMPPPTTDHGRYHPF